MKFTVAAGPLFRDRAPLALQIASAIEQQRSLGEVCEPAYKLPTAEQLQAAQDELSELIWKQRWRQ